MRILFVGPPLYGLLYPVLSLAQAFRVNGHEVWEYRFIEHVRAHNVEHVYKVAECCLRLLRK